MNLDDIINFSDTLKAYRKEGKATTIDGMLNDIDPKKHPDWVKAIETYKASQEKEKEEEEEEEEEGPLCEAYSKVKELFTKGLPSFKLLPFDLPVPPAVLVAETTALAEKSISKNGPIIEEMISNNIEIESEKVKKELEKLKSNQDSPPIQPRQPRQQAIGGAGGSIYFTKEECSFF